MEITSGWSINVIASERHSTLSSEMGMGTGPTSIAWILSPQKNWSPKKGTTVVGHWKYWKEVGQNQIMFMQNIWHLKEIIMKHLIKQFYCLHFQISFLQGKKFHYHATVSNHHQNQSLVHLGTALWGQISTQPYLRWELVLDLDNPMLNLIWPIIHYKTHVVHFEVSRYYVDD